MKKLSDGTLVSARSYYYLLDFNEVDEHEYMKVAFGKFKLNELTKMEYKILFNMATTSELNSLLS